MRFLNRLKRLLFPRKAIEAEIDRKMREAAEEAARIWLDAAIPNVPVWSGASRATFEQLAGSVGYNVPINVDPNAPNRIALGRFNSRGGIERTGKGSWRFYYVNQLRYLNTNETQSVSVGEAGVIWGLRNPTPYNFTEAAEAAVKRYLDSVELPRITLGRRA